MGGQKTTALLGGIGTVAPRRRWVRVVRSPDAAATGRRFELDGRVWLIGREAEGLGRIEDGTMSREHLRIGPGPSPGSYVLEELSSRNGVFLNGVRLARTTTVLPNQVVSIGETLLVVDQDPDPDLLPAADDADGSLASECVGSSGCGERLRRAIATAAAASGSVVLLGPTGSGKEVAAQAIHRLSARREGPWVPVNCAAISPELAEDYFFGHKRGAFSGADRDRVGYFAEASGGTLFLDEVGELALPLQAKLLRVLQDGSIRPIGATADQTVDVRIIAATHKDLEGSEFRTDLFARLSDWVLRLPSLAQRRVDILELWAHFQRLEAPGVPPQATSAAFDEALLIHPWPMNVRELQKLARRLATLARNAEQLTLDHLPQAMQTVVRTRTAPAGPPAEAEPTDVEPADVEVPPREVLEAALKKARGNLAATARDNGWHRTQVYRWVARYQLDLGQYR